MDGDVSGLRIYALAGQGDRVKGIDIVPRNKELTLEITSRCQLECPWCSTSASPSGKDRPAEDCISTLKALYPQCNVVRISGGEPTLHPGLSDILRAAKEFKYQVVVMTNGQSTISQATCDLVDEFIVQMYNHLSYDAVDYYRLFSPKVSMHVVAVEGFTGRVGDAVHFSLLWDVPLRVLALQKQGRGVNCQPSKLITWSGSDRCQANNKITVAADGTDLLGVEIRSEEV